MECPGRSRQSGFGTAWHEWVFYAGHIFCFLGPFRRARDVPSLFELVGSAGVGCVRGHVYRIGELYRRFVAARRVGAKAMTTLTHKLARTMLAETAWV